MFASFMSVSLYGVKGFLNRSVKKMSEIQVNKICSNSIFFNLETRLAVVGKNELK
jgi:hypothetical protein